MDLNQRKLDKSEWESIEVPVVQAEQEILTLITNGYHNVNIKYNNINSLFTYLKVDYKESMEDYLYTKYFEKKIEAIQKAYPSYASDIFTVTIKGKPFINKADSIRIEKNDVEKTINSGIFEYTLISIIETILKSKKKNNSSWVIHYFTLYKLTRIHVVYINSHINNIVQKILAKFEEELNMVDIIKNSVEFIEKNKLLLKYADKQLYDHQKELFTIFKNSSPYESNLVLYIAPTGTGKTLSPIGLSEHRKVIFICAARHVGLALAKSAISVGKKIAFAFGCNCAADIRLHYFAAKEFTKDWKTGGIRKVDNSIGDKVEIMICDIKSYLPAMFYMQAFNPIEKLVLYWDEPTITMDQPEHELHATIHENWRQNIIPNIVLSSATLPKLHELTETISNFIAKFPNTKINNIVSHDCKKSIPLINKNGYVILPHLITEEYEEILKIVAHCENNLSLLRYFDLAGVVDFIQLVEENNYIPSNCKVTRNFASLDEVTMLNIKIYYLKVLKNIIGGTWGAVSILCKHRKVKVIASNDYIDVKGNSLLIKSASIGPGIWSSKMGAGATATAPIIKMNSMQDMPSPSMPSPSMPSTTHQCGIYITTKDAFTLTDGPTIFLATDIEKISQFYIQQASIPAKVMSDIIEKIGFNNKINDRIAILDQNLEDIIEKGKNKTSCADDSKEAKKINKSGGGGASAGAGSSDSSGTENKGAKQILQELEMLRSLIKTATLNDVFIPNKPAHIQKWAERMDSSNAFTSHIDDETVIRIMMLTDVIDSWKVMLLMGIGVFTNHKSITYTEIMKKLADEQRLYMIIASSDYIYGMNYQFCHGYLSKDLCLTQEKIIQALGRIGRNNIQQTYSVRFRDDEQINKLFYEEEDKIEVHNMNKLFSN